MSKVNGDFHSVSPLRTFFDENLVEAKIFQSCQISALKETISAIPEASYIFDSVLSAKINNYRQRGFTGYKKLLRT